MSHEQIIDSHILHIIENQSIADQIELQEQLQLRGFVLPQATISRRLKKLGVTKINGAYQVTENKVQYLPLILNVQISDAGLMVLHTNPGNANVLAYWLDKNYVHHTNNTFAILGTIAGDDTILVVHKNYELAAQFLAILKKDFSYL